MPATQHVMWCRRALKIRHQLLRFLTDRHLPLLLYIVVGNAVSTSLLLNLFGARRMAAYGILAVSPLVAGLHPHALDEQLDVICEGSNIDLHLVLVAICVTAAAILFTSIVFAVLTCTTREALKEVLTAWCLYSIVRLGVLLLLVVILWLYASHRNLVLRITMQHSVGTDSATCFIFFLINKVPLLLCLLYTSLRENSPSGSLVQCSLATLFLGCFTVLLIAGNLMPWQIVLV